MAVEIHVELLAANQALIVFIFFAVRFIEQTFAPRFCIKRRQFDSAEIELASFLNQYGQYENGSKTVFMISNRPTQAYDQKH